MTHWDYMPKIWFVSQMEWPVAKTRAKKETMENAPRDVNFQNFEKKMRFLFMSQGTLSRNIRLLGQKLWPAAPLHTQTHRESKDWVPYQAISSISCFCPWYERSNINKHNAELRRTAPGAKVSCSKFWFSYMVKYGQKFKFHEIFLIQF